MKIAVTGSTGQLGRLVIENLKTKIGVDSIFALARSPEKALDIGVAIRPFDYNDAQNLEASLSRIDTLLLISSSELEHRATQHKRVIDAAKAAGVGRIVFTSLLHADTSPLDLAALAIESEKFVIDSGLPFTILRNGWYAENYTAAIPGALASGAFIASAGDGLISAVARADLAEAAAVVLTTRGHEGVTYELAGDEAWTLSDLAAELSRQANRDIPYNNLPQDEYAVVLESFGLPAELAKAIAGWDIAAADGGLFDDSRQLSRLIGRPTTTLAQSVRAALD